MHIRTLPQKLMALGLSLLLVSCGATRHTVLGATGPHDLARYVLVIQEMPDGQVKHTWRPVNDFDLAKFTYRTRSPSISGPIRLAARGDGLKVAEECYTKRLECESRCLRSSQILQVDHYVYDPTAYGEDWADGKEIYCPQACAWQQAECVRSGGRKQQIFTEVDAAVDWLERHHTEVLVGTIIIIVGVPFVVVVSEFGALLLAPILLFAYSDVASEPVMVVEP
jgi:hypothetical protein